MSSPVKPQLYLKVRPVLAVQYAGSMSDIPDDWRAQGNFTPSTLGHKSLRIQTTHGVSTLRVGGYLLQNFSDTFYPVPQPEFEFGHRPVTDSILTAGGLFVPIPWNENA